jgi:hypothetical protein
MVETRKPALSKDEGNDRIANVRNGKMEVTQSLLDNEGGEEEVGEVFDIGY